MLKVLRSGSWRLLAALVLTLSVLLQAFGLGIHLPGAGAAAPLPPIKALSAPTISTSLVISQVYGGGGNASAPYQNDFIELFNPTSGPVSVNGFSVQYASAAGSSWTVTSLPNATIAAGGYFLIQEAVGSGCSGTPCGIPLPTPDAMGTINMSATAGKVALVNTTIALSGSCPVGGPVVDFVGFGTTANCFEGSGPAPAPSNTTSDIRAGGGCTDTDSNNADFATGTPTPRNSSSPLNPCPGGATSTPTVTGTPPTSTSTSVPTDTRTATNTSVANTATNTPNSTSTAEASATATSTPAGTFTTTVYLYMVHYTSYSGQADEGVRLINTTNVPASVGLWSIIDSSGSVTLPVTATIPASGSIWIGNTATGFGSIFGFSPDYEYAADSDPAVPQAAATGGFNFPDSGDAVRLLNSTGQPADTLVYKNGNIGTTGWSGAAVQPYLPAGQPNFQEAGQIFYRKLDETTGRPVTDTNTKDDWAQDDDPAGTATPVPGDRENDDINGKKLLRPGWALTNPAYEDMFFTKQYTDTNVTTKFLVDPDNGYDAVRNLILGATQSITIETYEWHNSIWVQDIIDAHTRGVNVGIILDGNPCCTNTPDNETLWSAKRWEDAGIPVYFFSGVPNTSDSNYRYNNVHAKIMMVDNQWVLTGSDNFTIGGMTNDPRGNGTGGNRGAMIITNAPDVVSYTARLISFDFQPGRYADVVRYPALGTPPPAFSPTPFPDVVSTYTPVKPTPLVVTETESIEIVQSPDNALRDTDSLIGLVNQADAGDQVMVEQQYERKYWEGNVTNGPNPRLAAYIRAAQRGANVRIILDGFFEGGDCSSTTHNPATVAYVNGLGLPNLHAEVAVPSGLPPDGSGNAFPGAGNIHNKMVLVTTNGGTKGYLHVTSINGSLNSAKNNREYGLQIQSNAGYQYYKDVFEHDWNVGYLPCGAGPTPTAGTPAPTPSCNALVNGDFETGDITPWTTTNASVTAVADNEISHSGDYSIAISHNLANNSQGVQQNIPITIQGGAQYRVQGWVLRPDPNIASARVRIAWYTCPDFSCSQLSTVDVFAGNTGVETWQFFSGTVTAPASAVAAKYRLLYYNATTTYTTIHYDDVLFECQPYVPATATTVPTTLATATATLTPVRIHDIEGAAHISPRVGQVVSGVPGIVTAKLSNSFYLQDPNPDADDSTSEGIIVFTSSAPTVNVGDSVLVSGTVTEFRPGGGSSDNLTTTEIGSPAISIISSGNTLPTPVVIGAGGRVPPNQVIEDDAGCGDVETCNSFDPAQDGVDFYESLESMRVQVNNAVVVGPTAHFSGGLPNAEVYVVADNGANAGPRTYRGGVVVQPNDFNPERIIVDNQFLAIPDLNVADTFTQPIVGVYGYNFGKFLLHATSPVSTASGGLVREVAATPAANELTVANFNMENLAATDPITKFNQLSNLIVNHMKSPDLIVAEEIQDNNGAVDDGTVDASQTYNALINAIVSAGGPTYQYRQIDPVNNQDGGQPGGNIRQGFLFRTDRGLAFVDRPGGNSTNSTQVLTDTGVPRLLYSPGRINPNDPAWTASRKPLAGEFTYNGRTIFLIGNHFNSKTGDDPLFGKHQPPVLVSEQQRIQQANIVASFGSQILQYDPFAYLMVAGDLNDYEFAPPVVILKNIGLTALLETLPQDHRYSYVFQGNSQALDHELASNRLLNALVEYKPIHVNSEYADQVSDHEPEVGRFFLPPLTTPTASATAIPTNTATTVPTNTAAPTSTAIPTNTATRTSTAVPTSTNTAVSTSTTTSTNTSTRTSTATNTAFVTSTTTRTSTVIPSATSTATASRTGTATPTVPGTVPATRPPSNTPTYTSTSTSTAVSTFTSTAAPSSTQPPADPTPTRPIQATNTSTRTNVPQTSTPTVTATSTACTITFTDVPDTNPFYTFIRCLACRGIVNGYTDGTFRPFNNITRGQIAKIISNAAGYTDAIPSTQQTFDDVPNSNAFWLHIERIYSHGAIGGYTGDGVTLNPCTGGVEQSGQLYFRWCNNATRGQIAKIDSIAIGYNETIPSTQQTYTDVPNSNPFWVYIERIALHGVIAGYPGDGVTVNPCTGLIEQVGLLYFRWCNNATRGQTAKIVANTFFPGCETPRR